MAQKNISMNEEEVVSLGGIMVLNIPTEKVDIELSIKRWMWSFFVMNDFWARSNFKETDDDCDDISLHSTTKLWQVNINKKEEDWPALFTVCMWADRLQKDESLWNKTAHMQLLEGFPKSVQQTLSFWVEGRSWIWRAHLRQNLLIGWWVIRKKEEESLNWFPGYKTLGNQTTRGAYLQIWMCFVELFLLVKCLEEVNLHQIISQLELIF